ncbi:hypothetical protein JK628_19105 [Shewanella sp. KX20019]|uniref:hypothetical protein n=1 Tax=Shewanella sp. KX20019 TaxID=2803864 RepID=UPI001928CF32|nr:hypothetical protein [Shewanella sp. KX20019]QQX79602.1 hypothetical protein JK628_19105 [Shewanella sp. KX20019]
MLEKPTYTDGLDDGCHSGKRKGFIRHVQKRYQTRVLIELQRLQQRKKANHISQQTALEQEVMKGIDTDALNSLAKQ